MVEQKTIKNRKMKCEDALVAMKRFIEQGEKINYLLRVILYDSKLVKLDNGQTIYDWLNSSDHILNKVYRTNLKSFYDAEQIFYQYSKFVKNSIGVKNNKIKKKAAMNEDQLQEARELIEKYNLKRDIVANKYKISVSTLRKYLKNGIPEEEKIGMKKVFENINSKLENDLNKKVEDVTIVSNENNEDEFNENLLELESYFKEQEKKELKNKLDSNMDLMNNFNRNEDK